MTKIGIIESIDKPVSFKRRMLPLINVKSVRPQIELVTDLTDLSSYDYLILQSIDSFSLLKRIYFKSSLKIVYDDSDHIGNIFPNKKLFFLIRLAKWIALSIMRLNVHKHLLLYLLIRRCDLVVTGSKLQAVYVKELFNKQTFNFVDPINKREYSGTKADLNLGNSVSIIWEGSNTSLSQLLLLESTLVSLYHRHNFQLVIVSDRPKEQSTIELLDRLNKRLDLKFISWSILSFNTNMEKASIAIAPIATTEAFNISKPFNKLLSYGAFGLPVIASNIPAYCELADKGLVSVCNDQPQWYTMLEKFILNPALRTEYGDRLFNYTWRYHNESLFSNNYVNALVNEKV